MSGLKSMQEQTRRRLVALGLMLEALVASLVGVLMGLVSLETVVGSLVGGMAIALMKTWAMDRDSARLAALENKEKNGPRLILPPGGWLRDMLHIIYPPKTAERVFDQTILDMQLEWQEAMIHEKKWLARWVRVRGGLAVFFAAAVHIVATLSSILKLVR